MKTKTLEPKTIEISRVVVEFASLVQRNKERDLYPIGVETTLTITQDQDAETGIISWNCIGGLNWWFNTISQICDDRACRVETGDLLPGGSRMKPEAYLGLWRQAKEQAITFEQLLERGLLLVATIRKPTSFCKDMQASDREADQAFAARMTSPHIVKSDDHEIVWRIPINSLDNLLDYTAVNRWHDSEKYPGEFNKSLDIEYTFPAANTAQAPTPATQVARQQVELFSEAA